MITDLQGKVGVIGHQAEAVDAAAEFLCSLLQEQVEAVAVPVFEKDRIAGIAAKNDMIHGAWIVDAGLTWHDERIAGNSKKSSLTPWPLKDSP